jgi:hypothetical protein
MKLNFVCWQHCALVFYCSFLCFVGIRDGNHLKQFGKRNFYGNQHKKRDRSAYNCVYCAVKRGVNIEK